MFSLHHTGQEFILRLGRLEAQFYEAQITTAFIQRFRRGIASSIDDEDAIVLLYQSERGNVLSVAAGSPRRIFVCIMDDEVPVVWQHQAVRSHAPSVGARCPG